RGREKDGDGTQPARSRHRLSPVGHPSPARESTASRKSPDPCGSLPPAADAVEDPARGRSGRRRRRSPRAHRAGGGTGGQARLRGARGGVVAHEGVEEARPMGVEFDGTRAQIAVPEVVPGPVERLRQPDPLRLVEGEVEDADVVELDGTAGEQVEAHPQRLQTARRQVVDREHVL
ncbi:MAG: hypothetical protein ACK56I_30795, partial [bacterium]